MDSQLGVDGAVRGIGQTLQDSSSSPLGMILAERPDESCGQCCYRLRWRWSSISAVSGICLMVLGIIMSIPMANAANNAKGTALIIFFIGLILTLGPISAAGIITYIRSRLGGGGTTIVVTTDSHELEFDNDNDDDDDAHPTDDFELVTH